MASTDPIRILVMHDDPVAQAGLASAFARYGDFEVQDEEMARGGASSLALRSGRCSVDVVVADYPHGLAIAGEVKRQSGAGASPRVVIVAGIDREWEIRSALECGVRGYLLSGCALAELADAARAVHRGARHLSPQVAARMAESLSIEPLTTREEEVLRLVVEGLCNKAIGRKLGIAVGTVKSHLKATFDKLGVESRTQAMATVERRGMLRLARGLGRAGLDVGMAPQPLALHRQLPGDVGAGTRAQPLAQESAGAY